MIKMSCLCMEIPITLFYEINAVLNLDRLKTRPIKKLQKQSAFINLCIYLMVVRKVTALISCNKECFMYKMRINLLETFFA